MSIHSLQQLEEILLEDLADLYRKAKTIEVVDRTIGILEYEEDKIAYTKDILNLIGEFKQDCRSLKNKLEAFFEAEQKENNGKRILLSTRKLHRCL